MTVCQPLPEERPTFFHQVDVIDILVQERLEANLVCKPLFKLPPTFKLGKFDTQGDPSEFKLDFELWRWDNHQPIEMRSCMTCGRVFRSRIELLSHHVACWSDHAQEMEEATTDECDSLCSEMVGKETVPAERMDFDEAIGLDMVDSNLTSSEGLDQCDEVSACSTSCRKPQDHVEQWPLVVQCDARWSGPLCELEEEANELKAEAEQHCYGSIHLNNTIVESLQCQAWPTRRNLGRRQRVRVISPSTELCDHLRSSESSLAGCRPSIPSCSSCEFDEEQAFEQGETVEIFIKSDGSWVIGTVLDVTSEDFNHRGKVWKAGALKVQHASFWKYVPVREIPKTIRKISTEAKEKDKSSAGAQKGSDKKVGEKGNGNSQSKRKVKEADNPIRETIPSMRCPKIKLRSRSKKKSRSGAGKVATNAGNVAEITQQREDSCGQTQLKPSSQAERMVRSLLNKISPENESQILTQLVVCSSQTSTKQDLFQIALMIMEKALDDPFYSHLYARCAARMCEEHCILPAAGRERETCGTNSSDGDRSKTRLSRCVFANYEDCESFTAFVLRGIDLGFGDLVNSSDEDADIQTDTLTRGRSLMCFIGNLFIIGILPDDMLQVFLKTLVDPKLDGKPNMALIECACELLLKVGGDLAETACGRAILEPITDRLYDWMDVHTMEDEVVFPPRMLFMVLDMAEDLDRWMLAPHLDGTQEEFTLAKPM